MKEGGKETERARRKEEGREKREEREETMPPYNERHNDKTANRSH